MFAAEDAAHIVRTRLEGIARAAGADFHRLHIAVIDVPVVRLDHRGPSSGGDVAVGAALFGERALVAGVPCALDRGTAARALAPLGGVFGDGDYRVRNRSDEGLDVGADALEGTVANNRVVAPLADAKPFDLITSPSLTCPRANTFISDSYTV